MKKYQIRELTKNHVNTTIFVRGSGNNLLRGSVTPIQEALVVKVMSKNMVLKINNKEVTLRINGTTENHFNYDMYESIDDFKAELCIGKIRDAMMYNNEIESNKVLLAAKTLGIEIDLSQYTE